MPIDKELLAELDNLSRSQGSSRSAVIRLACREYLWRVREQALDEAYERGYRRVPEDSSIGEAQAAVAAETLPEEPW